MGSFRGKVAELRKLVEQCQRESQTSGLCGSKQRARSANQEKRGGKFVHRAASLLSFY